MGFRNKARHGYRIRPVTVRLDERDPVGRVMRQWIGGCSDRHANQPDLVFIDPVLTQRDGKGCRCRSWFDGRDRSYGIGCRCGRERLNRRSTPAVSVQGIDPVCIVETAVQACQTDLNGLGAADAGRDVEQLHAGSFERRLKMAGGQGDHIAADRPAVGVERDVDRGAVKVKIGDRNGGMTDERRPGQACRHGQDITVAGHKAAQDRVGLARVGAQVVGGVGLEAVDRLLGAVRKT